VAAAVLRQPFLWVPHDRPARIAGRVRPVAVSVVSHLFAALSDYAIFAAGDFKSRQVPHESANHRPINEMCSSRFTSVNLSADMHPIAFRLCLLLVVAVPALTLSSVVEATDDVAWSTNIEGSLREAAAAGKPVLLEFTASWCVYCKRMEKTTLTDPAVAARIAEHFVAVRVDADKHKDLVSELGIKGLPAILIVSPDLQIIERISGFQTPEALVTKLDQLTAGQNPVAATERQVTSARPAAADSRAPAKRRAELEFEAITHEEAAPDRRANVRSVSTQSENPFAEATKSDPTVPLESNPTVDSNQFFETVSRQAKNPEKSVPNAAAAFGGTCIVSAVEERELVAGSRKCQLDYRGQLLYFRSEDHKQKFLAQPASYWPMLDGACAMTLLNDGERVEGQLQYAAVFRKRIWLFTSETAMREFLLDPADVIEEVAERNEAASSR